MPKEKAPFSKRWGSTGLKQFTPIATTFIRHAVTKDGLGLTYAEAWAVCAIQSFRWTEELPWVSVEELAAMMDMSYRGAFKLLRRLERKGILRMIRRPGFTSLFDLSSLYTKLAPLQEVDRKVAAAKKARREAARFRLAGVTPSAAVPPQLEADVVRARVYAVIEQEGSKYDPPVPATWRPTDEQLAKVFGDYPDRSERDLSLMLCHHESLRLRWEAA